MSPPLLGSGDPPRDLLTKSKTSTSIAFVLLFCAGASLSGCFLNNVLISSPLAGKLVTIPQSVPIRASVTDGVVVNKIDFYRVVEGGRTLIGSDSAPPFEISWSVDAEHNGHNRVIAVGHDGVGGEHTSNVIRINVVIEDRSLVFFPQGQCETEVLELQVNGQAHPDFPRLATGTCLRMDPTDAVEALRVRCIDPLGTREPSGWTRAAVFNANGNADLCEMVVN